MTAIFAQIILHVIAIASVQFAMGSVEMVAMISAKEEGVVRQAVYISEILASWLQKVSQI